MKLSKFVTPILVATLAIASTTFGLTSCSSIPNKIKEFIHDRSFSLMASAICKKDGDPDTLIYGAEVFGTGWIIDDSTPNNNNDYCYNIATNWHVTRGFDLLEGFHPQGYTYVGTYYFFGDKSSVSNLDKIIDITDYKWFGENNYLQCDEPVSDYLFTSNAGIDFHVCNVNFAKASSAIKTKLDKVNAYRKEHGYINKFVVANDATTMDKTKYVGGFPMKESWDRRTVGGKWEIHKIDKSSLSYHQQGDADESHYIDSDNWQSFPYYDASAQYTTNKNFGTDWMTGGASGSMLLTQDMEICGIYWGGHTDSIDHPTWFQPRFSLLKTSDYDFISRWTN